MRTTKSIAAGTKPDRQGEALARTALEDMVAACADALVLMTPEHDPLRVPIGRVVSARIIELAEGHAELEIEAEVWEPGDTPENVPVCSRQVRVRDHTTPELGFGIRYRGAPARDLSDRLLPNLPPRARPRYIARKGMVEGIPDVVIWLGVFVAGGFFQGLLAAVGEDAWNRAKEAIREWYGAAGRNDESLEVAFAVRTKEGFSVEVVCILPTATEKNLRTFLEKGVPSIDRVLSEQLGRDSAVRKVVFQWVDGDWGLRFTVDANGIPSRIEPIDPAVLMGMGFSVTASAPAQLLEAPLSGPEGF